MKALVCILSLLILCLPIFALPVQTPKHEAEYKPFQSGIRGTGYARSNHGYEKFVDSIPVKNAQALEIKNTKGNVRLIGWEKPYVKIEAKKVCPRSKRNLQHIDIGIRRHKNVITIETLNPMNLCSAQVHYTIYVPFSLYILSVKTSGKVIKRNVSELPHESSLMKH